MPIDPKEIEALRDALRVSPNNVPLRRHLADTLLKAEAFVEAEVEFKRILTFAPNDVLAAYGLARVYALQGKNSMGLVVLEDLMKSPSMPAAAFVLYARLLAKSGQVSQALSYYRQGVAQDPQVKNAELEELLGITPPVPSPEPQRVQEGKIRQTAEPEAPESYTAEIEKPEINFAQVGGMQTVKEEISVKIILPMSNQELYAAYGKKAGGGILLYGPPGCGKTYLARATAGEVKAKFISVGLHQVLDMWLGQSEQRLHGLFEQARRNHPCILFFDEVDALGASRSDMRQSAGRQLINQFLSELDGVSANNEGVLVLAATNAPWHLDNAFRRPGRFDRIIFIPPPDRDSRREILRILLKPLPAEEVEVDKVSDRLEDFSGADLRAVVDLTVEDKLREAMKTGKRIPITTKDLVAASRRVKPSTKEWFATARNYALYANEGGLYDEILQYLKIK